MANTTEEKIEEHVKTLVKHSEEIGSLKHRMDNAEKKFDSIESLTLSINKLAVNMEYMCKEQMEQGKRLEKLENTPLEDARYYKRQILSCIITALVGAVIGALLALIIK